MRSYYYCMPRSPATRVHFVNLTTEMWHPVSRNSTSRIDNAWEEFPRSGYSLTTFPRLGNHAWFAVIILLVYCYSLCGCYLWRLCVVAVAQTCPRKYLPKRSCNWLKPPKGGNCFILQAHNCCYVLSQQNI